MCGKYFRAIIDTGSPVPNFTKLGLQKIVGERKVVITDMIEGEQLVSEFPKLFGRKGRVKNYEIKIKIKNDAKIFQQKRRRVPVQLQNQVYKEI